MAILSRVDVQNLTSLIKKIGFKQAFSLQRACRQFKQEWPQLSQNSDGA